VLLPFILPGFGQFYNGDYLVGLVLIILEVVVNSYSNLNLSIYYTFNGNFAESLKVVNWQWILFYPSILNLGMWTRTIGLAGETMEGVTGALIGYMIDKRYK